MITSKKDKTSLFYDLLKQNPYGYFLIWGHGLQYQKEILGIIKKQNFLTIKRISYYEPKDIKHFVKIIYSYDYAPFWHLKAKTKYKLCVMQHRWYFITAISMLFDLCAN